MGTEARNNKAHERCHYGALQLGKRIEIDRYDWIHFNGDAEDFYKARIEAGIDELSGAILKTVIDEFDGRAHIYFYHNHYTDWETAQDIVELRVHFTKHEARGESEEPFDVTRIAKEIARKGAKINCPHCGKVTEANDNCKYCGAPITREDIIGIWR